MEQRTAAVAKPSRSCGDRDLLGGKWEGLGEGRYRGDEGNQLAENRAATRVHSRTKRGVFEIAMPKLDLLPPETIPAFFGQPSQQIDLWFTNIGCAEFGESISDPLAPWCISKDVVFFFVSHDQEHNTLGLSNPSLLQL